LSGSTRFTVITDYLGVSGLERYQDETRYCRYLVLGIDPGLGIGGHATGIEGVSLRDGTQLLEFRSNSTSPRSVVEKVLTSIFLDPSFETVLVVIESNTIGKDLISRYLELPEFWESKKISLKLPPLYQSFKKDRQPIYGFESSAANKQMLIAEVRELIKQDPEVIKSHRLVNELLGFQILPGGKLGAKHGSARTDDLVIAYALALKGRQYYFLHSPDPAVLRALDFPAATASASEASLLPYLGRIHYSASEEPLRVFDLERARLKEEIWKAIRAGQNPLELRKALEDLKPEERSIAE